MTAAGLAGRPMGLRFRDAFLGTVAAGALSLAFSGPALAVPVPVPPAGCTIDGTGTIETCTGNQSAGVTALPPPITTLNVNSLTQAVTPASGINGITFTSAGAVTVNSDTGTFGITTAGAHAHGIFAKSTGGGAVTVTSTGNITTQGNSSYGILARTYGAGVVAVTSAGNITTASDSANGISAISFGGGAVTVTSTGNIATAGFGAGGIYALTTGTGAVTVTSTGNITTAGLFASGIYTKSAGAVAVTSIGNITTAGNSADGIQAFSAGAVTVTSTGNITTAANAAYGIYAKSNGNGAIAVTSTGNITTAGGNGYGINASGGGAVTVTSTGNITTTGTQGAGIRVSQSSNDAGALTVTSIGNITTAGSDAFGIRVSQSSNDTGAMTVTSTGNITTTGIVAGGISAQGHAAIAVTSTGNISTAGSGAVGIEAFSTGAGAVSVASTGNITTAGSYAVGISAVSNSAGAVTVTSSGNITTTGNGAAGISAFSTYAGAVTVTSSGNITTVGGNASGIYAQGSGGPIAITIKSGTVSGGTGTGAGVTLLGGTTNTLTNMGTLTALSGLAIQGDTGNNTVNNSGTVIGNVILGTGTNAFNNMAGGFFNAGATVNLGAGNMLTNAGTLSPGGAGVIQTTALTGSLTQTATGRLVADINISGATGDRINVSGTANLAGAVQLQVQNLTFGAFQQTVVSAAGGTTNNGLTLVASPLLQAQLVFPNATDVVVKSSGLNFVTPGQNTNQIALGNALNAAGQSGGLGGPLFNFLLNGITSIPAYNLALTQLSGEGATGTQQATFDAMNIFMGTMLDPFSRGGASTPGGGANGYASEGDASAYAADGRRRTPAERDAYAMFTKAPLAKTWDPRWSVWAAGFGGSQTTDGNAAVGSNGATSRIAGAAVGADYLLSPNTIAGFALAGGGTSFSLANNAGSGRSDLFQAGVYARHTMGAAYIAGALAYGWQDITTNRTVTLAGIDQLQARFNANAFSGRLEGGYRFVSPWIGGIGITPYAAAQFTTFDLPAYAEQALVGTNAFALAYGAKSVTDPRSELGFRTDKSFAMPDGILTLRGRLAWAHDYDPNRAIGATFQSLPGASFVVNGAAQASDSVLTTASVEMRWRNNWSIAATFEGEFSNVTSSYAGKGVVRYQW
jgi:uncharacterized protein with beta-barrel porin domain